MGSPQGWPPYASGRDCSIGFCSIYCPQWCYFYFPPPPPPSRSPVVISPLLIAIIVVVSTAFAVVAGYLIALRYRQSLRRQSRPPDPAASAPHPPPPAAGLDSSVINKLTIFRYRRGAPDGPVPDDDRDCSVCLGEFRDGDSLRLLPKCAHAFHKGCIDTWLSSHSNCPLCRAGVFGPVHEYRMDDGAAAPEDLEAGRTGGAGSVGDGDDDDDDDYNDDEDDVVIEVGRQEWTATSAAGESSSSPSAAESSVLGKGPPL